VLEVVCVARDEIKIVLERSGGDEGVSERNQPFAGWVA
jgi:hypothetical protein